MPRAEASGRVEKASAIACQLAVLCVALTSAAIGLRVLPRFGWFLLTASIVFAGCSGNQAPEAGRQRATEDTLLETDSDPVVPAALIPLPVETVWGDGHLLLPEGGSWPRRDVSNGPADDLDDEEYRLTVDAEGVTIVAGGDAGAFYAEQTLDQLVQPADANHSARVPFVSIVDRPRFEWRGFMLDVSRHFFDVGVIKKHIDVLSRYKINRLHLHLTDDQGWRIQIDSWPALTSIGASINLDEEGPGGFYTAQDYAEITDYAAERFITVVPEIDMPGHVNAALASYGELNDDGKPTELSGVVPYGQSALSIEAPATSRFIDDVFSEVAAMTPGEFIHIGGDEAHSLDQDEYSALTRLAVDAVIANGKTPIGWEETVTAGLPQSLIVQYWLDSARARQAADAGNQLIVSPAKRAYLDMKYDDTTPVGQAWAGLVEVDTAYDWDPTDEGLADDQVLGIEAPLWTETIRTAEEIDYMTYPRMLGYAEIGWTPQAERKWSDYRVRLAQHGVRLTDLGIEFYASPTIEWDQG